MEKLLHYIYFDKLKTDPSQRPTILSETMFNPKQKREKMAELLFETFNIPTYYTTNEAVLALYSSGLLNMLVFVSGDGVSCSLPVIDGVQIMNSANRIELSGFDVTTQLQKLISSHDSSLASASGLQIVRDIKEKYAYVATKSSSKSIPFTKILLPNEHEITLSKELFECAEILFDSSHGLHKMINKSIKSIKSKTERNLLYGQIFIAGGNTMLKGFPERIEGEIKKIAPKNIFNRKVKVLANVERENAVWIGGAAIGEVQLFDKIAITMCEYKETGKAIVNIKC
ncbi:actin [Histomonas meleagridis]|uniref:actin n=1 Tax=Histomonas meleagridis TaxID=135588 RepID=UPI00355A1366|nr:actin [Histomonas meleagridis]KAH0801034.1 actin [Histomonas meleagridis]